jgi:DUF1680 family protein
VEQVDNPGVDLYTLTVPQDAKFTATFEPDLLDGVATLRGQALRGPDNDGWGDTLYRTASATSSAPARQPTELVAVPYYAWANRAPGAMLVWVRGG